MVVRVTIDKDFGIDFDVEGYIRKYLLTLAEESRRFAVGISPVITGSYRDSHKTYWREGTAVLTINPRMRNYASNILVTRYASNVEEIHAVYFSVEEYAEGVKDRMVVSYGD